MTKLNIRQLKSGGLITNYFCTSSCAHCLYNCSPQWEKRYIDPHTAEKNLIILRSLGCRSVHIGGGEPLLRPDDLGRVLQIAAKLGVSVEYVETNSSWFKDESPASCYGELSNTSHFHIDLFGNYIPGLCSGLSIASEDLGKPLGDETYPILTTLCRHGIRKLVQKAEDSVGYFPQKDRYINKCDLCTEVRTFLVQNDYSGSEELNPAEFYIRG